MSCYLDGLFLTDFGYRLVHVLGCKMGNQGKVKRCVHNTEWLFMWT